jgi:uncharacterized repeat protein (TIGR02543 family)
VKRIAGGIKQVRQLQESVDAGDFYQTPSGPRKLYRLSGRFAVRGQGKKSAVELLTPQAEEGKPFAGYTRTDVGRDTVILSSLGTGKEGQETRKAQKADKAEKAASDRTALAGLRKATGIRVDPVFVDPDSGTLLIVGTDIVVCLKADIDAEGYFGDEWARVRPMPGTKDQFILTLDKGTAEAVLEDCVRRAADDRVEWAEPDFQGEIIKHYTPNDTYFNSQWHLKGTGTGSVQAQSAWDTAKGDDIVIAIIDDGVQTTHPDLQANIFVNTGEIAGNGIDDDGNGYADDINGWNFVAGTANVNPAYTVDNHGTAVAGVAAAVGNNSLGVAGVAFKSKILPVKISSNTNFVNYSVIAMAIRYAAGLTGSGWRGADVINCSWGGGAQNSTLDSALTAAASNGRGGKGCPIFVSSGNYASGWYSYSLSVSAGSHTIKFEYAKDSSDYDGLDRVWLDDVYLPGIGTESFEGTFPPSGWSTGGHSPWLQNTDLLYVRGTGTKSVRSGTLGNSQTNYLQVTKTFSAGTVSFYLWTSTEYGYDVMNIYRDGVKLGTEPGGVNAYLTPVSYPASHSAVMAVGASTDYDYRSDYSQFGTGLDFVAPSDGGASGIYTTDRTGTDGYSSTGYDSGFGGTSSASPLAAGIGALILSKNPSLTVSEVRAIMRKSCAKIGGVTYSGGDSGAGGWNTYYGYGRITASTALANTPANTTPPSAPTNVNASDGDSTASVTISWSASSGATSYSVYRYTSNSSSSASLLGSTSDTTYTDNNAEPGVLYYYWVKATNSAGISGFSSSDTGYRADVSDYTYTVSNGKVTITGYTGAGGNVTIPSTIEGYPVATIGYRAFAGCLSLESVTIPAGVTRIGMDAFSGCASLESVTIPGSVTVIGEGAFWGCRSLTSVTIPNGVTEIGSYAFRSCTSLTSVTIPSSVTSIGSSAFRTCTSLTSVTIPSSVTVIVTGAFSSCTSLTNILVASGNPRYTSENGILFDKAKTYLIQYPGGKSGAYQIPNGVTGISPYAFLGCVSLTGVTIPNGVTEIGSSAFSGCTSLTSVTIPGSLTRIDDVFDGCTALTGVTILNGVTEIYSNAFRSCTSLTSVTIPSSVTSIIPSAFYRCTSLTSILVSSANFAYTSEGGVLFNKNKSVLICYPGGKSGAYQIPNSVTSIGGSAFSGCTFLTSVTIPGSVTSIGYSAFSGCTSLSSVTIPSSVTNIGYQAFYGCTSLTSVTIPGSVTSIDFQAFTGCISLTGILVSSANSVYTSENGILFNKNKSVLICYPGGKSGAYQIPNGVTSIGNQAFQGCVSLTSVTIPGSVTSIGYQAFQGCASLASVTIPDSVTSIGYSAFSGCDSLASVYFKGNAPSPGSSVFYNAPATIYYVSGTTGWGATYGERPTAVWTSTATFNGNGGTPSYASRTYNVGNAYGELPTAVRLGYTFGGWYTEAGGTGSQVTTSTPVPYVTAGHTLYAKWTPTAASDYVYTISNGKVTITGYTGAGGDITIPSTIEGYPVAKIGEGAFSFSMSLTCVTVPDSVTNIASQAFISCRGLTNVVIGSGVSLVGVSAFYYCPALESITVSSANPYYLSGNGVLFNKNGTELIMYPPGRAGDYSVPSTVTRIAECAFFDCIGLTGIVIPQTVTEVGAEAFALCGLTNAVVDAGIIGEAAFVSSGIESVTFGTSVTVIGEGAFTDCPLAEVNVPANVNSVGANAFEACWNLTNAVLNCGRIGDSAFSGCESMTDLTLGAGMTVIGASAFEGCYSLTSVTIPDSVTDIGDFVFGDCYGLTRVVVGSGVAGVGDGMFAGCENLEGIYFKGDAPWRWWTWVFADPAEENEEDYAFEPEDLDLGDCPATVYYVHGTEGWDATYGGLPTAVWTSVATFNGNGGAPSFSSRPYNVGNAYGELPTATRSGYTFGGWYTGAGGTGSQVTTATPVPYVTTGHTLYASWTTAQQVATPSISPTNGTEFTTASKRVTISCTTEGAEIRYTTDGADPTASSALYAGAFNIYATTMVKARAFKAGMTDSEIATAVITKPTVATPVISPADGTEFTTSSKRVTITCETVGAEIRYTTDGIDPTASSALYAGAFNIYATTTVKARAFKAGMADSGIAVATITKPVVLTLADALDMPAWTVTTGGDAPWTPQTAVSHDGADAARTGTIGASQTTWLETTVSGAGTLSFWWRASCENSPDDDWDFMTFTVDGVEQERIDGDSGWLPFEVTLGAGEHTLRWAYTKDGEDETVYEDCGWVDQVVWTPGGGGTTAAGVPFTWLDAFGLVAGGDYEAAALADTDGDGHAAWQEYVAGTDPTNRASVFTAAIAVSNGAPFVTWTPDLGAERLYTVEGKARLTDAAWASPTNAASRFFRVKVGMPE